MQTNLHQLCNTLNESASQIKTMFIEDRQHAADFLEVCEEHGLTVDIVHKATGKPIPWREAPEEVIKVVALQMFDRVRKEMMN